MTLLTKKIIDALPPLYATDGIPLEEKVVICKFFTPDANWTWFVFEGVPLEHQPEDYELFGMVHGFEKEMGYFYLSELNQVRGKLGLPIERDLSIFQKPYGQCHPC